MRLALLALLTFVANVAAQPVKPDINGDPLPEGAVARLGTVRFQPSAHASMNEHERFFRFRFATPSPAALSPDGTVLATVHVHDNGGRVDFMDTATGKTVRQLQAAGATGEQMQFTPDGKRLVFSGWHTVTIVDARTGEKTGSIAGNGSVGLTRDGKWLATQPRKAVYDAPVDLWETATGKKVVTLPGRGADCKGLAFSPDSKRLLLWSIVPSAAGNGGLSFGAKSKVALVCIDIEQRKFIGEATAGVSQHVALCADGETVGLEAADRQSVRVRHLPTGVERCTIPVKQAKFAFAPDGKTLVTIDEHGWGALWDAAKGSKIRDFDAPLANKDFQVVGISDDDKTVAVLDGGWQSEPRLVVWNTDTGRRVPRPPGHEGTVKCIAYAPDGKVLVSGSVDQTVRLWNAGTGAHLRKLADHSEAITAVGVSADGTLAASACRNEVRVSRIADGKLVAHFVGPDKGAKALSFSADGKMLFAGGESGHVLAWRIAGAKEVTRLSTGSDGSVLALARGGAWALSAHGSFSFFSEDADPAEALRVWSPFNKLPVATMPLRHEKGGSVRCDAAIFSADTRLVASSQISEYQGIRPSYGAALLRLWERASGQPILTLSPTVTTMLAFSPDGRLLASGGAGESGHLRIGYGSGIDVWDTFTGQKAGALSVTPVCVAFSPDGLHLATGGRDHSILIWKAPKPPPVNERKSVSPAERDAWWTALGGQAKEAYKAMGQMVETPEQAVAYLKERVEPVQSSDPDVVAKLITQLDSDKFTDRAQAQAALEKMGEGAAHLIKKADDGKISLELHRRLEALLRKCDATSPDGLRRHRAVAALEWIGTPAARAWLQTLAGGAPWARLTKEADAALERLGDGSR